MIRGYHFSPDQNDPIGFMLMNPPGKTDLAAVIVYSREHVLRVVVEYSSTIDLHRSRGPRVAAPKPFS